jgi:hypothetical protein
MEYTLDAKANLVSGVADVRHTPLNQLAREAEGAAGDSLQHVLPADADNRVTIAAFGSSI